MPFSLMQPVFLVVVITAIIGGLYWVADAIGDHREASVRAEYTEAARKKNVAIEHYNTAQEALDAVIDAKVQEALAAAKAVPSELHYTPEQAAAITAIRRAGR